MSLRSLHPAFLTLGAVLFVLVASCGDDRTGPLDPNDLQVAWNHSPEFCETRPNHPHCPGQEGDGDGGNGEDPDGDGEDPEAEEVVVQSIAPDSAAQGTTEEVVVRGDGFGEDSELTWELGGEPTDQITTLSTRVVNSGRLEATIAVSADAPEALFDVVVQSRGRRGVGIEIFEVVEGNVPLAFTFEPATSDGAPAAITGDGRVDGWYRDGECGVSAIVNVDGSGPDSPGDALLRTNWRPVHPRERGLCEGRDERVYTVRLDEPLDGAEARPARDASFANINDVEWVTHEPALSRAAFNLGGCNLRFGDAFPGTDPVLITPVRQGGQLTGWTIETTGGHVGVCAESGTDPPQGDRFRVPFRIVIWTLAGEAAFPF